jgi:methyl-accepting chemotaxis protein
MKEQREGGKQVLGALSRLRDITKEIERGSEEMAAGNESILGEVGRLRALSMAVIQSNQEILGGTKEIDDAIAATQDLASRNAADIGKVRAATDRFEV